MGTTRPRNHGPAGDPGRRAASLIAGGLIVAVSVAGVTSKLLQERKISEASKARRRESMRAVAERWHFRQWERDLDA